MSEGKGQEEGREYNKKKPRARATINSLFSLIFPVFYCQRLSILRAHVDTIEISRLTNQSRFYLRKTSRSRSNVQTFIILFIF